ncbi:hypothetical protein EON65_11970 [archaeon]|nr:MAG: hypothetical protein EON65_11970 [archaeon]
MIRDDLLQLKIQRRVVAEQIDKTDKRLERLGEILLKKTQSYSSENFQSLGKTNSFLEDIRLSPNKVKAVPKVHTYDPYALDASPITNANILRIRQNHGIRTKGRDEIRNMIKHKAEEERIKEEKNKPRTRPEIKIPPSMLPNRYKRGELPCTIEHGTSGLYLSWACPLENLDYEYYLPLFFDGLQCKDHITSFIARQGIEDMLYASRGHPERIIPVLHLLARPLRNALAKFDEEILLPVLKSLEQLILSNAEVGAELLKYGRQFLVPIAYFMDKNKHTGDKIDYGQRRNDDVGEQIRRVLELMEEHGGPRALQLIKFSVPLCKSSLAH